MPSHRRHQHFLQGVVAGGVVGYLHIHQHETPYFLKYIVQGGDALTFAGVECAQFAQRPFVDAAFAIRRAVERWVVHDDYFAGSATLGIQFNGIGALFARQTECGECVLWRVRAGSPVPYHQWSRVRLKPQAHRT